MTITHDNPAILTRRSTLGLLLAGLVGNAAGPTVIKSVTTALPPLKKIVVPQLSWPSLDNLAQTMVAKKLTPGLSLSVMHAGTLLYSKGFGVADVDNNMPVTPQVSFRIASITKQFTAAAILLLAEDGLLSIDDSLAKFLPDFPKAADITLRQMMSHTSGMGDYINGQAMSILTEAQNRNYGFDDLLNIIKAKNPLYRAQPGATWLYSNSGFTLLGLVIEKLSGGSLGDFFHKRLIVPAGLTQTGIDLACNVDSSCNGYRPNYKAPTKFDLNAPISPSFAGGAGALRSTTEDLCTWHCALLDEKVLKPHSLKAMITPTLLKNGKPALERGGKDPIEYGLGQALGTVKDIPYASHGGRINGYTGHLGSFPDNKLTIAILYNSDGGGAPGFTAGQRGLRVEAARLGLEHLGLI